MNITFVVYEVTPSWTQANEGPNHDCFLDNLIMFYHCRNKTVLNGQITIKDDHRKM